MGTRGQGGGQDWGQGDRAGDRAGDTGTGLETGLGHENKGDRLGDMRTALGTGLGTWVQGWGHENSFGEMPGDMVTVGHAGTALGTWDEVGNTGWGWGQGGRVVVVGTALGT